MSTSTPQTTVTPLAGSLGVRIEGIDLATDASEHLVDALRTILDEHLVIHLPGQADLTPAQQLELAALWGEVVIHPSASSIEDHPGIVEIAAPTPQSTMWQHDVMHLAYPTSVAMLVARVVPSSGGDTLWANQYTAYERFSPGLRETLDGLYAVHEGTFDAGDAGGAGPEVVPSVHPVVVTHDRTGRKALFVGVGSTTRLDGWTEEESAPLLDLLCRTAVRNEYTCRHRWATGDLVIWDTRATLHCEVDDVASGEQRSLHRVTIAGALPG